MDLITLAEKIRLLSHTGNELFSLSILIFSAFVLGSLAQRLWMPEVTGYIISGIILGRSGLHIFSDNFITSLDTVNHLALGLMAFIIGTHVSFHKLRTSGKRIVSVFYGEEVVTFFTVFAVFAFFFFHNMIFAFLLAAISISTAPATTVAIVKETKARGALINTLMPAVAVNNAICIILFGIFLDIFTIGDINNNTPFGNIYSIFFKSISDIALSAVIGITVGFFLKLYAESGIKSEGELLTIVFLLVMAATGFSDIFHVNPMLPSLIIGIYVSNATTHKKLITDVLEGVQHIILLLFFVMAGLHFDLSNLGDAGLFGASYFFARFIGKMAGGALGAYLGGSSERIVKYIGYTLLPQSGVAIGLIVLAKEVSPLSRHIDLLVTIVLATVTLNEIFGPFLSKWAIIRAGEANQDRPRLIEFIGEEYINTEIKAVNKKEAIAEMVSFLIRSHGMSMKMYDQLLEAVLLREEQMSTGIGDGIAVPHGVIDIKGAPYIWGSIGLSRGGIEFNPIDSEPVHLIILVITPSEHKDKHIKILAEISRMLRKKETRDAIFKAKTSLQLYEILRDLEMRDFNYFID